MLNYVGAAVLGLQYPGHFRQWLMIGAHVVLGARLLLQQSALEAANFTQGAIAAYYRFIWQLFYLEYCLFPLPLSLSGMAGRQSRCHCVWLGSRGASWA